MEIARSLPGVMQTLAATVRQFKISSGVCSRFKPLILPLLQFWKMDPSWLGGNHSMAVTVRQFKSSSRVWSRFKPHMGPLPRFWKMDPSSPGVMQARWRWQLGSSRSAQGCAADSSHTDSAFAAILEDGSAVTWGDARFWWWQFGSSRSAQGCATDSSHKWDIWGRCCHSRRWIGRHLGWCLGSLSWRRRWQFGSSRSAKGCAADSGHSFCLCCDSWRWIRCDLGLMLTNSGGDSSAVQDQLKGVLQIQATEKAFAAILEDGFVAHLGSVQTYGGDSSAVRDQLKGVQQIQATHSAFAATLEDGSVVTWGRAASGGDSSAVQDQLKGVHADSSHRKGLCCDSGRWILSLPGVMQLVAVIVFQFEISWRVCSIFRPQTLCLCCDSGRWICGYLGSWRLWRWQFGSSRSAELCLVQLCIPKWQSPRSYIYRNRRCWSFCSAVTPSVPGCWKRWGSYKRSLQKCCFLFFCGRITHMEVAVDLVSMLFQIQHWHLVAIAWGII